MHTLVLCGQSDAAALHDSKELFDERGDLAPSMGKETRTGKHAGEGSMLERQESLMLHSSWEMGWSTKHSSKQFS